MNTNTIPRLRSDIEVFPYTHQGHQGLLIKDTIGIITEPIFLFGLTLELIRYINGKRSIKEIQLSYVRDIGGTINGLEEIVQLIVQLDSLFLLDSELYQQKKASIMTEYLRLPIRKAILAGNSYPQDPVELKDYLDGIFSQYHCSQEVEADKIQALLAPHIDIRVGERVYAKAYHAIKPLSPNKIILLGTAHNLQNSLIAVTEKDFETPLGRVETDKMLVKELKKTGQQVISDNDFVHRNEHSLELQLIFLQYLFGKDFSIVPILFGSFHNLLTRVVSPEKISGMKDVLDILRAYFNENISETVIVAGVDFSHVGLKFGDPFPAANMLSETQKHDEKLLEAIYKNDVREFWKLTKDVNDKYKCCGFSTIASLLEIIPNSKGRLLDYDVYKEDMTQSAVTFAAVAMSF